MKKERIPNRNVSNGSKLTITETGNIIKSVYSTNTKRTYIKKLDADTYLHLRSGQIREFKKNSAKVESVASVYASFKRLREIINTNCTSATHLKWCTLTYKENMTDSKQLYEDFRKFWLRFKYYLKKEQLPIPEYICVSEPQQRGAWHCHVLFIWESTAPFISNDTIARIWKHGFTNTQSVKQVDNFGAYLCAYVTDLEVMDTADIPSYKIKGVDEKNGKSIVKGARLHRYPLGMNIYRCSKGIKKPIKYEMIKQDFVKKMKNENIPLVWQNDYVLYNPDKPFGFYLEVQEQYYNRSFENIQRETLITSLRHNKMEQFYWDEFINYVSPIHMDGFDMDEYIINEGILY